MNLIAIVQAIDLRPSQCLVHPKQRPAFAQVKGRIRTFWRVLLQKETTKTDNLKGYSKLSAKESIVSESPSTPLVGKVMVVSAFSAAALERMKKKKQVFDFESHKE